MIAAILSVLLTVLPVIVAAWVRSYNEEKAADDAMGKLYRDELRAGLDRLDGVRPGSGPGSPADRTGLYEDRGANP